MACSAVTGVSRPISRCMLSVAGFAHEFNLVHSPAADILIARRLHIAGLIRAPAVLHALTAQIDIESRIQ
jgi:hypothetical protein